MARTQDLEILGSRPMTYDLVMLSVHCEDELLTKFFAHTASERWVFIV